MNRILLSVSKLFFFVSLSLSHSFTHSNYYYHAVNRTILFPQAIVNRLKIEYKKRQQNEKKEKYSRT